MSSDTIGVMICGHGSRDDGAMRQFANQQKTPKSPTILMRDSH